MKQISFFAAGEDLAPVFDAVEESGSLMYVLTGRGQSPHFPMFRRGSELPHLGIADAPSAIVCASYLIAETAADVRVRRQNYQGVDHYFMDQLINPDTVAITPAGVFYELAVLGGRVATASDSDRAQALMKRFQFGFKKHFKRVKTTWVGREAQALLAAGRRLTMAVQSPIELDLKPD